MQVFWPFSHWRVCMSCPGRITYSSVKDTFFWPCLLAVAEVRNGSHRTNPQKNRFNDELLKDIIHILSSGWTFERERWCQCQPSLPTCCVCLYLFPVTVSRLWILTVRRLLPRLKKKTGHKQEKLFEVAGSMRCLIWFLNSLCLATPKFGVDNDAAFYEGPLGTKSWVTAARHSSRYFFFQMSHIHFYIFLILLTLHLWLLIPGLKKEASKTRQSSSLMTGPLRCLLSP